MQNRPLANYLRGGCPQTDLQALAVFIAADLEREWHVPIASSEVLMLIEQWSKTHQTQPGAPITMPPREPRTPSVCPIDYACPKCGGYTEAGPHHRNRCLDCGHTYDNREHRG